MKNYLILLTETERLQVVEAMTQCIAHINFGNSNWVNSKAREKHRNQSAELLEIIKQYKGGFKLEVKESLINDVKSCLSWYSHFLPQKKIPNTNTYQVSPYYDLSYYLLERNRLQSIFNFDPQTYNPLEEKPITKAKINDERFIIIRFNDKNKIDFVIDLIQYSNESNADYTIRIDSVLEEHNENIKNRNLMEQIKVGENENFGDYLVKIKELAKKSTDNKYFKIPFNELKLENLNKECHFSITNT